MKRYSGRATAAGLIMIVLLHPWYGGAGVDEPLAGNPHIECINILKNPAVLDSQPRHEVTLSRKSREPGAEPAPSIHAAAKAEVSKPAPSAGDVWTEPATRMKMVWVPGGCYSMGCGPWSGDCHGDESPVHEVCVDGFWIGMYEVTQAEWRKVMGSNPSRYKKKDDYPAENISWDDARELISKLNSESEDEYRFRLPTEAEWEYACRSAGKDQRYSGGSSVDSVAWYKGNSHLSPHVVGSKAPNGLGIYDMSGNVWEWVEDSYSIDAYSKHQIDNPMNSSAGAGIHRTYRGGSWYFDARHARCGFRYHYPSTTRSFDLGIRLVRARSASVRRSAAFH